MNTEAIIITGLVLIGITQFIGLLLVANYMRKRTQQDKPGHLQSAGLEDITAASMKAMLFNQLQWEHIQRMAKDLRKGDYDEDKPNGTAKIERILEAIEKHLKESE